MHMTNVNTYTWSLTQFAIFVSIPFVLFVVLCITTEIPMYSPMSVNFLKLFRIVQNWFKGLLL